VARQGGSCTLPPWFARLGSRITSALDSAGPSPHLDVSGFPGGQAGADYFRGRPEKKEGTAMATDAGRLSRPSIDPEFHTAATDGGGDRQISLEASPSRPKSPRERQKAAAYQVPE